MNMKALNKYKMHFAVPRSVVHFILTRHQFGHLVDKQVTLMQALQCMLLIWTAFVILLQKKTDNQKLKT